MAHLGTIYGLHSGNGVIRYIGQTLQKSERRLAQHRYAANYGNKYPVYVWMRKHGAGVIQVVSLETCEPELLNECEIAWIARLKSRALLNVSIGGYDRSTIRGNTWRLGKKDSDETRQKKREAALRRAPRVKGYKLSAETRARMSAAHTGLIHPEHVKAKITGRPPGSKDPRRRDRRAEVPQP